jgi:hypothetical protein
MYEPKPTLVVVVYVMHGQHCALFVLGGGRTLITGRPVQHTEDLEDVAVAVVAMELVAGAVKTEDNSSGLFVRTRRPGMVFWCRGRCWAGRKVG